MKIAFVGNHNHCKASDRVFGINICKNINKYTESKAKLLRLNELEDEKNIYEYVITIKGMSEDDIKMIKNKFSKAKIIITNPSTKRKSLMRLSDYALVGSAEEKAFYDGYIDCIIYPCLEEIETSYYPKSNIDNVIVYHGNKMYLDGMHNNLRRALYKLVREGYTFRAIYDIRGLGKTTLPFISEHIQWEPNSWLSYINKSTVGIAPACHYPGRLQTYIAKIITSRHGFSDDILMRYKNCMNGGRSFVYHQLSVPVVADICSSHNHVIGNNECGFVAFSQSSWYENIKAILTKKSLGEAIAKKAFDRFTMLYDTKMISNQFVKELESLRRNNG